MKDPGQKQLIGAGSDVIPFVPRARRDAGIEVREEELGQISAQRLYKMRCGCGRSWFELQLPHLATCPACTKMGLVSL